MRAGLATLRELADGAAYARLEALGATLEAGARAAGLHVQRVGSIAWLPGGSTQPQVVRTPGGCDAGLTGAYAPLFAALLDAGIYLPPSPFEAMFLSTAHDEALVGRLVAALAAWRTGPRASAS
jgi:glutamate-1-semialdehyde 2,1-aminomutase